MDPELAWQQIDILTDYGFNYFFESGDSFMVGNFPERLLEARPEHLKDSTFKIYASPNQITPEKIKVLKELGVAAIFLGLETPEETILKKAGKTYTKQDIDRATSLISEAGIQLQVPFIYGLPGTTLETMETTFQYAKQLVESHPNTLVYGNKAIPIAGSQLFKDLASDPTIRAEYSGDLLRDDQLDYQQLVQLQTKHRTDVTYEQITEYVNKTRALVENENALGFGENK